MSRTNTKTRPPMLTVSKFKQAEEFLAGADVMFLGQPKMYSVKSVRKGTVTLRAGEEERSFALDQKLNPAAFVYPNG